MKARAKVDLPLPRSPFRKTARPGLAKSASVGAEGLERLRSGEVEDGGMERQAERRLS